MQLPSRLFVRNVTNERRSVCSFLDGVQHTSVASENNSTYKCFWDPP